MGTVSPMGQKATGPATPFGRAVVAAIEAALVAEGLTKAALIERSGVPANTFHTRMRGDKPFNTNEIEKLAKALGRDPLLLLREAASAVDNVTPLRRNDSGYLDDALKDEGYETAAGTDETQADEFE